MPLRITIEWIPKGEKPRSRKLFQSTIEEESNSVGSSDNENSGDFRVEATDYGNSGEIETVSFRIRPVSRKNFLDTAIECLGVLHSTSLADKRLTMLSERNDSDRSRFNDLFDHSVSAGSGDAEPVVLLSGGGTEQEQTPMYLPIPPFKRKTSIRSHQPDIDTILDVVKPTSTIVDEPWVDGPKAQSPIHWYWFAFIALIIAGASLWSLIQVNYADEQVKQIQVSSKTRSIDEKRKEREAVELIDGIEASVRKYFSCSTVEELTPLVRQTERVVPLMREYYKDKPVHIGNVDAIKILQPLLFDTRTNFWMVGAILSNGHQPLAIVEIMDSGEVRVDWESLVCHQPMDWSQYAQNHPAGTTMDFRVYAKPADFHSHEFKNPKEWLCVCLTALDSIEFLFGYARIDSLEGIKLRKLIRMNGLNNTSLILRLKIPDGLESPRGVMIDKVLSPRWIYLDPPESGL